MDPFLLSIALLTCGVFVALIKKYLNSNSRGMMLLPPSPHCLPIIGNAYMMRRIAPHKLFYKISKIYGSIITFWVGAKPIVVVNEVNMAKEALLKQDKIFAGRPQRHSGRLYSKGFKGVVIADYGETWKQTRKLAHHALKLFSGNRAKTEQLIADECKILIERLQCYAHRNEAKDVGNDVSLCVINMICTMCFGTRYALNDPEFVRLVEANSWFIQGISSAAIIDAFPVLKYLPWCKSLKLLNDFVNVRDEILEKKFREHEEKFNEDEIHDVVDYLISFTRKQSEIDGTQGYLSRDNQIMLVGDLFIAGADTTTTSILWTLLYLAKWPEKQKKLHAELDEVLRGSPPSLVDKSSLPYLQATIYEALRLSSLTPLGVPRKATKATQLGGFDIPRGTTVMFNLYAMNHDKNVWEHPHDFRPERFLDEDDGLFHPSRVEFMPFSAGKRICLGESIAKMELFLILAYLLQCFEFKSSCDLDTEGVHGVTLKPKPFKLQIINR
eukprot:gene521-1171_t